MSSHIFLRELLHSVRRFCVINEKRWFFLRKVKKYWTRWKSGNNSPPSLHENRLSKISVGKEVSNLRAENESRGQKAPRRASVSKRETGKVESCIPFPIRIRAPVHFPGFADKKGPRRFSGARIVVVWAPKHRKRNKRTATRIEWLLHEVLSDLMRFGWATPEPVRE